MSKTTTEKKKRGSMTRTYNKLVRTKMPTIIEANGGDPNYKEVSSRDRIKELLLEKLKEEVEELCNAKSADDVIDEAGDVTQVILDYVRQFYYDREDLNAVVEAKRIRRGTFLNKGSGQAIFLIDVKEKTGE